MVISLLKLNHIIHLLYLILCCQPQGEVGSAGEQPTSDKVDECTVRWIGDFPFHLFCYRDSIWLKKLIWVMIFLVRSVSLQ